MKCLPLLLLCGSLVGCGDSKDEAKQGEPASGGTAASAPSMHVTPNKDRAGKKVTIVNPQADMGKLQAAAAKAHGSMKGVEALGARSLTSADIKTFVAIRNELVKHSKLARDRTKRSEFLALREAAIKKHGIENPVLYSLMSTRIRLASMRVKMKQDPSKLKPVNKGDYDVVKTHMDEITAAFKPR